jgi:hypothetical protein
MATSENFILATIAAAAHAMPERIECVGAQNSQNASLVIEKDGVMLSPRETKKWVISISEKELGRKLSKKEGTLVMQSIRSHLTVSYGSAERIVHDSHGNELLVSGPSVTWAEDARRGR